MGPLPKCMLGGYENWERLAGIRTELDLTVVMGKRGRSGDVPKRGAAKKLPTLSFCSEWAHKVRTDSEFKRQFRLNPFVILSQSEEGLVSGGTLYRPELPAISCFGFRTIISVYTSASRCRVFVSEPFVEMLPSTVILAVALYLELVEYSSSPGFSKPTRTKVYILAVCFRRYPFPVRRSGSRRSGMGLGSDR